MEFFHNPELYRAVHSSPSYRDDEYDRWSDLMTTLGYTWEAHKPQTEDGYTLTLFHITGREDTGPYTPSKPPVLFNHGDMQDAYAWLRDVWNDGQDQVPYHLQLADAGYDVWLANNRGTWYSQEHVEYDPVTDEEFWMYTWADMGLYDVPANIDKVKEQTGYDKIFYVGYSQGTIPVSQRGLLC